MNKALIIVLALFTVSAFAGTNASKKARKGARKEAKAACISEGKTKKQLKSCIKSKLQTTTAKKAVPVAPVEPEATDVSPESETSAE